ncbi:phosphoglycerate kinase [Candidatus Woesearchaeota archaeon]|nr:phosphoglycerate kinase [Candidatus Woesearchaeota archaeon]
MDYLTLDSLVGKLTGKLVFLRVDTNTTLIGGNFEPNERIISAGDTIKWLTSHGAKVVVATHNGREGNPDYVSVGPLVWRFRNNLVPVTSIGNTFDGDNLNDAAMKAIHELTDGEALLLENLRFMPGESKKMSAEQYAQTPFIRTLIDDLHVEYMISDGFSIAHRPCRSLLGFCEIPNIAGLSMHQELSSLSKIYGFFNDPRGKNVYILGGKKIQDYFALIEHSLKTGVVHHILTGGLLANLILYTKGINIGKPSMALLEKKDDKGKSIIDYAPRLRELLGQYRDIFEFPTDVAYQVNRKRIECDITNIPPDLAEKGMILDIGDKTTHRYVDIIGQAQLVYVKGPVGKFEDLEFNSGSSRTLSALRSEKIYSVMGGGDTTVMLTHFKVPKMEIKYISLAGGALLLALAGEKLPGVNALEQSYNIFHRKILEH